MHSVPPNLPLPFSASPPKPYGSLRAMAGLLVLLCAVAGCAATRPTLQSSTALPNLEELQADGALLTEKHIDCISLVCDGQYCWGVRCAEKNTPAEDSGQVVRVRSGALANPLVPPAAASRYWGSAQGLPGQGLPVFVIPWHVTSRQPLLPPGRLEAIQRHAEGPGRLVRHHIFPVAFKEWFRIRGINIHEETMLLEEHVHQDIHRGPKGGPWNEAWRQYIALRGGRVALACWQE